MPIAPAAWLNPLVASQPSIFLAIAQSKMPAPPPPPPPPVTPAVAMSWERTQPFIFPRSNGTWVQSPAVQTAPNQIVLSNADGTNPVVFPTVQGAHDAATDGQLITITGSFAQGCVVSKNNLTIKGHGSGVAKSFTLTDSLHDANVSGGVGLFNVTGTGNTIKNLEIFNVHTDGTGSGVRVNGANLSIINCYIHDCDDGILGGGGNFVIDSCVFFHNGAGDGLSHNIYEEFSTTFKLTNTISFKANLGNLVKSRTPITTIDGCTIGGLGSGSGRCLDYPNGGQVVIQNSTLELAGADNGDFVEVAGEGITGGTQSTLVNNCIIISEQPNVTGVFNTASTATCTISNCKLANNNSGGNAFNEKFSGSGTVTDGGGNVTGTRASFGFPVFDGTLACLPPPPLPTNIAKLLASMPAGTWANAGDATTLANAGISGVTNTSPSNITPSPVPPGSTGPTGVTSAWGSGTYDSVNNAMIIMGGGHDDYGGNEVYSYSFGTLQWTLAHQPTPNAQIIQGNDSYADGNPSTRHFYSGMMFNPATSEMIMSGGYVYSSPAHGSSTSWKFNTTTKTWHQAGGNLPNAPTIVVSGIDQTNQIYYSADNLNSRLERYTFSTNVWDEIGLNSPTPDFHQTSVFCPTTNQIYCTGAGFLYTLTPSTGLTTTHTQSSGATACQNYNGPDGYPGFTWHNPSSTLVGLVPGDPALYFLNPSTFAWTKHNPAASNTVTPPAENAAFGNGIFGRFIYNSVSNCFAYLCNYANTVFIYKPDF